MDPTTGIIITLICSAFFSASEIAFISADPLQVTLRRQEPSLRGRLLGYFYQRQDIYIGTTLIGNTISLVLYGVYMAAWLDQPIHDFYLSLTWANFVEGGFLDLVVLFTQTCISTLIVLASAEFLPKSIALARPNRVLDFFMPIMRLVHLLISPAVFFVVRSNRLLLKHVFKLNDTAEAKVAGLAELNYYIQNQQPQQQETSSPSEASHDVDPDIFQNALEFKDLKARDCMVHRTEITAVDLNDPLEKLQSAFIDSGHTKIIVYDGHMDNVVGYCHALRMYENPANIRSITTSIPHVPETLPVQELMVRLTAEHRSLALVTDEFGGTSGIITFEDIIEEIFGDIEDEHDEASLHFEHLTPTRYVLSARFELEDLTHEHGWKFPDGEYNTLGGFVMTMHGAVPEEGTEVVTDNGYRIEVLEMDGVRIERVQLEIPEKEGESEG